MKHTISAILLALLALAIPAPASAIETGTPAWTISGAALFEGPGSAYDVTGDVGAEERVHVMRCQKLWCQVRAESGRGWMSLGDLAFGHEPKGPFTGPRLNLKAGNSGTVCLYTGRNYTGMSICGDAGFVVRDFLLYDADNQFGSVAIDGDVSVVLCRDRFFQSYCQRINESAATLPAILINSVSSMRVYGSPDGSIGSSSSDGDAGESLGFGSTDVEIQPR
jgi:hypothetical protein